jgi:hypothetical protein
MHRVEIVAYTASMSFVFGGLIIKNHIGYKNRIFNCRWSKIIVDVSHSPHCSFAIYRNIDLLSEQNIFWYSINLSKNFEFV